MSRFDHLLFVCQKQRPPGNTRGDCSEKGSAELLDRLKAMTKEHGLKGKVRVTASGCLDFCAKGCTVVAMSNNADSPETWYTGVSPADAEALFESHVLNNQPLERLIQPIKER